MHQKSIHEAIDERVKIGTYYRLTIAQKRKLAALAKARGINTTDVIRSWIERDYAAWQDSLRKDTVPNVVYVADQLDTVHDQLEHMQVLLEFAAKALRVTKEFRADDKETRERRLLELLEQQQARRKRSVERREAKYTR